MGKRKIERCVFAWISIVLLCFSSCNMNREIKKGGELAGECISLGEDFAVLLDVSDTNSVKTDFTLIPERGKIEVEYDEGSFENIYIYLYDVRYAEHIQCGAIEGRGKSIIFSNLTSACSYYIKVEFAAAREASELVLSFSG